MHHMSIQAQAAVAKSSVIKGSGDMSLLLLKKWMPRRLYSAWCRIFGYTKESRCM